MNITPAHQIESPSLSERETELLGYFIQHQCSIENLKEHFRLSAREMTRFLTSFQIQAALRSMVETVRLSLEFAALQAREGAMSHLRGACERLAGVADSVNDLRLAATSLGKFAQHALTRPKTPSPKKSPPPASPHETFQPPAGDPTKIDLESVHQQFAATLATSTDLSPQKLEKLMHAARIATAQSLLSAAAGAPSAGKTHFPIFDNAFAPCCIPLTA